MDPRWYSAYWLHFSCSGWIAEGLRSSR
jgi:hypothetical protein